MNRKALVAVSILTTAMSCCGCVTTHSTKGYQTNPPVKAGVGVTQNNNEPKGVRKLFAGWNSGQKKNQPTPVEPQNPLKQDATSLQTKGTVSADLLIVAGEMGLQQGRLDLAKSYFERALKLDPNNARAREGLSKAASGIPTQAPVANPNQLEIQNRTQQLINAFGKNSTSKPGNAIRLVSFVDDSDVEEADPTEEARPESISVEQLAEYRKPDMTMSPAISVQREREFSSQRVANPYFTSYKNYFAAKSSRSKKKKRTFKIRPAKVQFEKARSISDDEI